MKRVLTASMLALIIISIGVCAVVLISALLWRSNNKHSRNTPQLPSFSSEYHGLFAPSAAEIKQLTAEEDAKILLKSRAKLREELRLRIENRDFSALLEAHDLNDVPFYDDLLWAALAKDDFEALIDFFRHYDKLPVSRILLEKLRLVWRENPTRRATIDYLHFAARSHSAEIFGATVDEIAEMWRAEKLPMFSADYLMLFIESEFWTLSANEKSSGAGFLVKQKILSLKEVQSPKSKVRSPKSRKS